MEILKQEGCMAWCLEADGKPIVDMAEEQQKDILDKLRESLGIDAYTLIDMIMKQYGDYECSDEPCECCGDYIETWRVEI